MVRTSAPERDWNVAHVFRTVWRIHFLHTGCVEHNTRLRSWMPMHLPQLSPALSATLFIIRSRCLSGFPFVFGNTNPLPGCRRCRARSCSASLLEMPIILCSESFTSQPYCERLL